MLEPKCYSINQSGFEPAFPGSTPPDKSTLDLQATRIRVVTQNYATVSVLTHWHIRMQICRNY